MNFLSIVILGILSIIAIPETDVDIEKLYTTRWLWNTEGGYIHQSDSFDFVTFNSPKADSLDLQFKYGGLVFEKDSTLKEYVWNKCGTGNPPDYYEAKFEIERNEGQWIINITNSRWWDGKFKLEAVSETNLKLIRII